MEDTGLNTSCLIGQVKSELICRLCLNEDVFMQPLCLDDGENGPLLQRIYQFTSIQITSISGFQQSICVICKNKIDDYQQFREQCIQNDGLFRSKYSQCSQIIHNGFKIKQEPEFNKEVEEGELWNVLESVSNDLNPETMKMNEDTSISLLEKWINKNIGDTRMSLDRDLPENKIIQSANNEETDSASLSILENWINTNGTNPDSSASTPYDEMEPIDPQNYLSVVQFEPENQTNIIQDDHFRRSKKYVCDICEKPFYQSAHLNIHRRIHTGERPFKCHLCPKSFVHGSNLKVHVKSHTGEKPFPCHICQRPFSSRQNLKNHMITHEPKTLSQLADPSKTLHQCPFCDKKCTYKSNLRVHIKTQHYLEKPYSCEFCVQLFTNNRNFKAHMECHHQQNKSPTIGSSTFEHDTYNGRQHSCPYCDKTCTYRSNLKVHIKTHFGSRPFKCEWCENSYASNQNLKRHLASHLECAEKEQIMEFGERHQNQYLMAPSELEHLSSSHMQIKEEIFD